MANTVSGTIKAYIEGLALGLTVDRNRARTGKARPYLVVRENIGLAIDHHGDQPGDTPSAAEVGQMDLWQDEESESDTLADVLTEKMHAIKLAFGTPAKQVFGVYVRDRVRTVETAALGQGAKVNTVRHVYTLEIRRQV